MEPAWLDAFLASIEQWPLAAHLRGSVWLYPLVNAAHIVGIALLFGAVVPLDLRLAGLFPAQPLSALKRVLIPLAATGLAIAALAGALLFIAKAADYANAILFRIKMALLALAVINAIWLTLRLRRRGDAPPDRPAQISALASIALWLGVIVCGRLVGYF